MDMDADVKLMVGTVQTDWFSWQVCDSATLFYCTHKQYCVCINSILLYP